MKVPLSALSFDALHDRWLRLIGIPVAVVPFVALTVAAYGYNTQLVLLISIWGLISTAILWHLLLWWVIRVRMEYPGRENTRKRIIKTFGGYSIFTILDQCMETRVLYQLDPTGLIPEPVFPVDYLIPISMALFFMVVVGSYYEGAYNLNQYRQAVARTEAVKKKRLENELARLKSRVNPHFLFNSLNSLSALINEDRQRAGAFLDELSSVYRYMLQAGQRSVVSLREELAFLDAYRYLLNERYGSALQWEIELGDIVGEWLLPPLTLQILIDNAIKYNRLLPEEPLTIAIRYKSENRLDVLNTVQPKGIQVKTQPGGLSQLIAQYSALGLPPIQISDNGMTFRVSLPMASQNQHDPNSIVT
ncbi:sensor histidine kinase [Spirosoma aerolatum]|uniref:sensor histidine kinase n=1 Tax=Spirosoma aerolatum TaxID=1211326 RepID=UPI0009AD0EF4|nr:histidine kinase [Spirosoma aerolatum]